MLGSGLHPKLSRVWQIAIPRSLILRVLILLYFIGTAKVAAQNQNISIDVTSPNIIYTPFLCNADLADTPQCSGAWQLSSSNNSVSTIGPNSSSGDILPQAFFKFRAFRLSINFLSSSTASVTLTISSGGVQISNLYNSALGIIYVDNLLQGQDTLLTITFNPSEKPTRLDLGSLTITVPENAPLSSLLPTPSLPTLSNLPSSTSSGSKSSGSKSPLPSSTSSGSSPSATTASKGLSKGAKIAAGIGITIALLIVITTVGAILNHYGKKRRERLNNAGIEKARSEWSRDVGSPQAVPVSEAGFERLSRPFTITL